MSQIRDLAAHCEAKLHGFRRTADGVVVSFVLHPTEVPQALALDPLGSRYMLAFVAISEDEQPAAPGTKEPPPPPPVPAASARSAAGKARYAASPERQQALVRSAQYPKDDSFQRWASKVHSANHTEQGAIDFIRSTCGTRSRAELLTNDQAYTAFLRMEGQYREWAGMMPEMR